MTNPSKNAIPAQQYGYLDHVWLYILKWEGSNGKALIPNVRCETGDTDPGCAETTYSFPAMSNPIYIDVENDYLPNVLPREMDVATNDPTLAALQAQAVAARTYATWTARKKPYGEHIDGVPDIPFVDQNLNNRINNSTDYQAYTPDAYDHYENPRNPAEVKQKISDAVTLTSGKHLSPSGDPAEHFIDAEFGNDSDSPTRTGNWTSYLVSVQDPISVGCDLAPIDTRGNGWGMSQRGALRWSKGNQCAGSGYQPWSVQWTDYRQILAHYYTGIDILDSSGGKVAPDNRWNLLDYNIAENPQVTIGEDVLAVKITVQNTSAKDLNWTGDDVVVNYQWTANDVEAKSDGWLDFPTPVPVVANIGNPPVEVELLVPPPPDTANGTTQTLHLDLKKKEALWEMP